MLLPLALPYTVQPLGYGQPNKAPALWLGVAVKVTGLRSPQYKEVGPAVMATLGSRRIRKAPGKLSSL